MEVMKQIALQILPALHVNTTNSPVILAINVFRKVITVIIKVTVSMEVMKLVVVSNFFSFVLICFIRFSNIANVVIAKPPPPMVQLSVGQVFIISCTAVGVPTPEVVWRLNWGHIPAKCSSTSINGVGTLTCPDIQIEDQGAYSCEAINIRGSIFAIPDTILVVDGAPSVCPRGTFNKEAHTSNECISCFCFGSTTECRSADLFTYQVGTYWLIKKIVFPNFEIFQLQPPFDSHKYVGVQQNQYSGVSRTITEDIFRGAQPEITPLGSNGVRALLASPYAQPSIPNVTPYFAMPENYQGNQLKSYGGYLKYTLHYEGFGRPIDAPDVIIIVSGVIIKNALFNLCCFREMDILYYTPGNLIILAVTNKFQYDYSQENG